MPTIEEIAERVERLLLRHEELKRTNALLQQQLATVTGERDSLRSRLAAARSRIDALLERLPADGESESPPGRPKATTPPRGADAEGVSGVSEGTVR